MPEPKKIGYKEFAQKIKQLEDFSVEALRNEESIKKELRTMDVSLFDRLLLFKLLQKLVPYWRFSLPKYIV